jgi:hypothetical protein
MLARVLLQRCRNLLSPDRRVLLGCAATRETVIASLGEIEIRQVPAGCLAVTLVKGDFGPARRTALVRLSRYLGGENRSHAALIAERPVLQQRKAAGLWQVGLRVSGMDDVQDAPLPGGRKVKPVAQQATTWAVMTTKGRASERKVARAEIEVLNAIARTRWFATGPATVRVCVPASVLQFAAVFEVAVPIIRRSDTPPIDRGTSVSRAANAPSLAVH